MAKVTAPLFSGEATGKVGNLLVFSKWRGIRTVRGYAKPGNPKTAAQVKIRTSFELLSVGWRTGGSIGSGGNVQNIDAAYKTAWAAAASGLQMSGFNLYIKRYMDAFKTSGTYPSTDLSGVTPIATPS